MIAVVPNTIRIRLSGRLRGSSIPAPRRTASRTIARPRTKTNFPSVPVFQPSTDTVGPSTAVPEYQPMNDDRASVSPATQDAWPAAITRAGVTA